MRIKKKYYVNDIQPMNKFYKRMTAFLQIDESEMAEYVLSSFLLRILIRIGIMAEFINDFRKKTSHKDFSKEYLSIELSEKIPEEGILINIKQGKRKFKIKLINTEGRKETHFVPLEAVKIMPDKGNRVCLVIPTRVN